MTAKLSALYPHLVTGVLSALLGALLSLLRPLPEPVAVYTGSGPTAPGQHKFGALAPQPTLMAGAQFVPSTNPFASGKVGIYDDSGLSVLRIHNADNSYTEISPGIAQPFPGSSSTPSGVIRWQPGANGVVNDFASFDPNDGHNDPYLWGWASSSNLPGDARNDLHLTFGANLSSRGAFNTAHGSMGINMETYCTVATGCPAGPQMEWYNTFTDGPHGGSWRWLTMNGRLDGSGIDIGLVGTTVGLGSGTSINDAQQLVLGATSGVFRSPSQLNRLYIDNTNTNWTLQDPIVGETVGLSIYPASVLGNGHPATQFTGPFRPSQDDSYDIGLSLAEDTRVRPRIVYVSRAVGGYTTSGNRPTCNDSQQGLANVGLLSTTWAGSSGNARSHTYVCSASDANHAAWAEIVNGGP